MNLNAWKAARAALLAIATAAAGLTAADRIAAAPPDTRAAAATDELTEGEVRRIDAAGRKLTLRHGEIRHLDMPGMTMVFEVHQPASIDGLKVGDRVRFRAESIDGGYAITRIEPMP
ncbi:MAG: copper-binding protein [Lautropia sp.]